MNQRCFMLLLGAERKTPEGGLETTYAPIILTAVDEKQATEAGLRHIKVLCPERDRWREYSVSPTEITADQLLLLLSRM